MPKKKYTPAKNPKDTLKILYKTYPNAYCELNHKNPYELLIATILSAQCTDERVNKVTPQLFLTFPSPDDMARADVEKIEQLIKSTGFYKNKAKNIKQCCVDICEKHDGLVPQNLENLVALAGVGRKTANVVLGVAFNIPNGIVVDTHVSRLSQRMGLSKNKTPEKIEQDLLAIVPKKNWIQLSHQMIFHGRQICKARNPQCMTCPMQTICPKNDYQ
ncbi:MAG: endonuclease III [Bdellovibrionaceae bacterium]|nr:endonuclease III [Pseudobdellovibrionaceae bacterium]